MASRVTSFGALPLAVVSQGRADGFPRTPARLRRALVRLWAELQDELSALSGNSVHVVALASDHDVPTRQPAVIVRAAQAVVAAARAHQPLPPCRRLFRGPDVRCRG
jgi:hypothetical protein